VSFAAITFYAASQQVFFVYFVIGSVRKLLDTFSYVGINTMSSESLVPVTWSRPLVAHGGHGLQMWRVAANMLNKQLRTADSEWSPIFGVKRRANYS
jgi:hypothetical protein